MLLEQEITYHHYNEKAILISWQEQTPNIISTRTAAEKDLQRLFKEKIQINHGAFSLLLLWENKINFKALINLISQTLLKQQNANIAATVWRLPVFYSIEENLLESFDHDLTIEKIIEIHTSVTYTVDFIGFLPGFPYLKGLDKRLRIPRKATPVLNLPVGSVAISNDYCGIYSFSSPGGWNVLGNCPLSLFDLNRTKSSLLKAGDQVQFYEVSQEEHATILELKDSGNLFLENFIVHA